MHTRHTYKPNKAILTNPVAPMLARGCRSSGADRPRRPALSSFASCDALHARAPKRLPPKNELRQPFCGFVWIYVINGCMAVCRYGQSVCWRCRTMIHVPGLVVVTPHSLSPDCNPCLSGIPPTSPGQPKLHQQPWDRRPCRPSGCPWVLKWCLGLHSTLLDFYVS